MSFFRSFSSKNDPFFARLLVGLFAIGGYICGAIIGAFIHVVLPFTLIQIPIFAIFTPFIFAIFGLWLGSRLFLNRPFLDFFTLNFPQKSTTHKYSIFTHFRVKQFFMWAGLWLAILLCVDVAFFTFSSSIFDVQQYTFYPQNFVILLQVLPLFIPLFFIQTLAEELLFRGWLTQFFGSFSAVPLWLSVLCSSVIFAFIHGLNPEFQTYGLWYFLLLLLIAIFLSLVTHLTNGIEAAWGVHFINNLYAFSIVSYPSAVLPTPSFFQISAQSIIATSTFSVLAGILLSVFIITQKTRVKAGKTA